MSPLTAAGLFGLAVVGLAQGFGRARLAHLVSILTLGLAGVVLVAHALRARDEISLWISSVVFGYGPALAGKMSVATAACLGLLATASLLRARPSIADWLGGAALVISGVAVLGYAYGVQDLYAVSIFNTMALHTAGALFSLAVVSLTLRPDVGWAATIASSEQGGIATRRQLAFIVLPPIAGGLLLRATGAHRLGPGAAMAFLVVLTVVPLALLILRDGAALDAVARERRRMSAELQRVSPIKQMLSPSRAANG